MGREYACPETGPAIEHATGIDEGRPHPFLDRARETHEVILALQVGNNDGEFVAAEPRDGVAGSHDRTQSLGEQLEQSVADVVTERIVDLLEMVEVEHQHADLGLVAARLRDRDGEPVRDAVRSDLRALAKHAKGGMSKKLRAVEEAFAGGVRQVAIGSASVPDLLAGRSGTLISDGDPVAPPT